MLRKTLIALTAAAALGTGIAATTSTAEAKVHFDVGVGIGVPGYPGWYGGYPGYGYPAYGYPVYADDYGCGFHYVTVKKWYYDHWVFKKKLVPNICY